MLNKAAPQVSPLKHAHNCTHSVRCHAWYMLRMSPSLTQAVCTGVRCHALGHAPSVTFLDARFHRDDQQWQCCVLQATIEKASIDEVYIDVTAMVDKELQVIQQNSLRSPKLVFCLPGHQQKGDCRAL